MSNQPSSAVRASGLPAAVEWRRACTGGAACVEVTYEEAEPLQVAEWHRGAASAEVAVLLDGVVLVRDGKDPGGPVLRFTSEEWAAFLTGAGRGEFELEVLRGDA